MKRIAKIGFLLLGWIFFSVNLLLGQTHETGAVLEGEYNQSIASSWSFVGVGEMRFANNFTSFDRFKLSCGINYKFLRNRLKTGVTFDYLSKNKLEYFENRYRVNLNINYTEEIRQWKLAYRARFQSTFYDEKRGTFRFNPKIYMRNRVQVEYALFSKPVKIFLSEEFFWRLYHPEKKIIDEVRTIIGVNYRIDKKNSIDIFLRMDNEVQVKDPRNVYYLGI